MSLRRAPIEMGDLEDLYQDVILDHYKSPRNRGWLPDATVHAEGLNPLCGDQVALHLQLDGERIVALRFEGEGCSISQASTSMLTEAVKGGSVADAEALAQRVKAFVRSEDIGGADLGEMEALAGVRSFPVRVKCATLGWNTLLDAFRARSDKTA